MASDRTHSSPDGLLRLRVWTSAGDVTLGFEGFGWHTHADILAATYGMSQEAAVERFLQSVLENKEVIVISRKGSEILDVWITDDPQRELRHDSEDEAIECRFWDGTAWRPASSEPS